MINSIEYYSILNFLVGFKDQEKKRFYKASGLWKSFIDFYKYSLSPLLLFMLVSIKHYSLYFLLLQ